MKTFFTIAKEETGVYKESGSSFLSYLFQITNINQFQEKLAQIKSEHPTASHHCYAYRLKANKEVVEFSSDAGEPSGSAGLPILNTLRAVDLINVAAIVVRYYGGTKLGIPGLINAYKDSTEDALEKTRPFQKYIEQSNFKLIASFEHVGLAYRLINSTKAEIIEQKVNTQNEWILSIAKNAEADFFSEAEKFHVLTVEKID